MTNNGQDGRPLMDATEKPGSYRATKLKYRVKMGVLTALLIGASGYTALVMAQNFSLRKELTTVQASSRVVRIDDLEERNASLSEENASLREQLATLQPNESQGEFDRISALELIIEEGGYDNLLRAAKSEFANEKNTI